MTPHEKASVLGSLSGIADVYPEIRDDVFGLMRKVLGPEPAPSPSLLIPGITQPHEPIASELAIARSGEKINAVKAYRARTGSGPKEAKDAIEHGGWRMGFYNVDGSMRTPSVPDPMKVRAAIIANGSAIAEVAKVS